MKHMQFGAAGQSRSVTYDPVAHAAYFQFDERSVAHTKKYNEFLYLDFDEHENLVGIEVLHITDFKAYEVEEGLHQLAKEYHKPELNRIHLDALQEAFH